MSSGKPLKALSPNTTSNASSSSASAIAPIRKRSRAVTQKAETNERRGISQALVAPQAGGQGRRAGAACACGGNQGRRDPEYAGGRAGARDRSVKIAAN